jgi:conjugal transfer pilus assembly protein TraK
MTQLHLEVATMMACAKIGVGTGLASRWLKPVRLVGAVFVGMGVASWPLPAFADQNVVVADNGTVMCDASLKDLTRISLKDDQFASVSKVTADNPSDDFQVVDEPLRGDIYISVPTGFTKPSISFFGTTHKGLTYKFVCSVTGNDAKQVFITSADAVQPEPVGAPLPAGLSSGDTAGRLISAMYSQKPVAGFAVSWRPLTPVTVGSLTVQLVGQYLGAALSGDLVRVENHGSTPVALTEEQVGPPDAVAVSIANPRLGPGEATTAFVVVKTDSRGGQQ